MRGTSMLNILRANPGLTIVLSLLVIGVPVLAFVGYGLARSTGNARPAVFIGGFMGLVLLPSLVGQVVLAKRPAADDAPRPGAFDDVMKLFGDNTMSVQDAKAVFPDFFGAATRAQLAIYPTGATTTVAQFPTKQSLLDAVGAYMTAYGAKNLKGGEEAGWRGPRTAAGDFVEIYRTDRELFVWTALSEQALAEHRKASDPVIAAVAPAPPVRLFPALAPLEAMMRPAPMKVAGVALAVLVASLWFFKGSAWAARVESPARAATAPLPAAALRERLLAVHSLDTPIAVVATDGDGGGVIDVTWKYADAKWVDHARAHGLKRTHRLRLSFDEADHTVRVIEQSSAYDWSAGAGGGSLNWQTSRGITFFEYRHERVFGLQFTVDGRPTTDLSYAYTFDLQELKNPVIEAVTSAGWTWQPTMLNGPKGLRWLTE